jgi:uncharacterized repeat protein (TIGR03803 family)
MSFPQPSDAPPLRLNLNPAILPMAILLLMIAVPAPLLHAQAFTVVHNFTGAGDGGNPSTGPTIDRGGRLYGTTNRGGLGTVFKMSNNGAGWILNTLYNFLGVPNGAYPDSNVVFGPDGRLYGATTAGGGSGCGEGGCGIVFALRPSARTPPSVLEEWTQEILYGFTGGADGASPSGALIFDPEGAIYGTDQVGINGWGAVYKLAKVNGGWTQSVLYNFSGGRDAGGPEGGVLLDQSGNLYGVAAAGGAYANGAVYRLTPSNGGWTETLLHSFRGFEDGWFPVGGLISDAAGNLYGTTLYGGLGNGGTVFMLSPSNGNWTFTLLYSLTGPAGSFGALALDPAGNLYGTTGSDGAFQQGNVFKLAPSQDGWAYTSLHDFTGGSDGARPFGNVALDAGGNIYGTTQFGGSHEDGVVFEITP